MSTYQALLICSYNPVNKQYYYNCGIEFKVLWAIWDPSKIPCWGNLGPKLKSLVGQFGTQAKVPGWAIRDPS